MISELLKGWHKEVKQEKEPVGRRWELVVRLVQMMFRDSMVPVEIAWVKMVLIPKLKGDYRSTGLVKVTCKVCTLVVNYQL